MLTMLVQRSYGSTLTTDSTEYQHASMSDWQNTMDQLSLLLMMLCSLKTTGKGSSDYKTVSKLTTHSMLASMESDLTLSTILLVGILLHASLKKGPFVIGEDGMK